MLNIFFIIISIALTTVCCIAKNLLTVWWKFYIPILMFVGFFIAISIVFFLILFIISKCINIKKPIKKPNRFCIFLFNLVNGFIIFWSGTRVKVYGKEKIDKNKKYLFVLNHKSNFDTMILSNIFKKMEIIYLSKPSNLKIPIAGGFIHKYGYLPIDRENNREAAVSITRAVQRIKQDNMSVGVCPEGTRNKTEEPLLPFRAGCFKVAKMADVPIAVVCIKNSKNIHKNFPFKRTKVQVHILDVLGTDVVQNNNTMALSEMAYNKILEELNKG